MVRFDCLCVVSTRLLVAMVCILPLMSSVWATAVDVRMPEMVDVQSLAVTATTPKTMGEDFSVTLISPKQITFTHIAIFAVKAQLHGNAVVDRHIVMQAVTNADSTCKLDKDTATATFTDKGVAVFKDVTVLATQDVVSPECTFEFILTGATADDTYTTTVNIAVDTTGHDKRITWDMQPSSNTFLSGLETRVVITPKANDTPLPDSPRYTVSIEVAPSSKNSCVLKFTVVPSDVINGQASTRLILQSSHASASPVLCDLELTLKQEDVHEPISTKVWSVEVVQPVFDILLQKPDFITLGTSADIVVSVQSSGVPVPSYVYFVSLSPESNCFLLFDSSTPQVIDGVATFSSVKILPEAFIMTCTLHFTLGSTNVSYSIASGDAVVTLVPPLMEFSLISVSVLQDVYAEAPATLSVLVQRKQALKLDSLYISMRIEERSASSCSLINHPSPNLLTNISVELSATFNLLKPLTKGSTLDCFVEFEVLDDTKTVCMKSVMAIPVHVAGISAHDPLKLAVIVVCVVTVLGLALALFCCLRRRKSKQFMNLDFTTQ